MSIGTTAIETCLQIEEEEEKHGPNGKKTFLGIIFTFGALLLRFLVYCLVVTYKVP